MAPLLISGMLEGVLAVSKQRKAADPGYVTTRKFCRGPKVETIYRSPPMLRRSATHPPAPSPDYSIPVGTLLFAGLLFD
jgi:hypothetical protein